MARIKKLSMIAAVVFLGVSLITSAADFSGGYLLLGGYSPDYSGGAGLRVEQEPTEEPVDYSGSTFEGNTILGRWQREDSRTQGMGGAGLYVYQARGNFSGSTFLNNHFTLIPSMRSFAAGGGALYLYFNNYKLPVAVDFSNSLFRGNSLTICTPGGGLGATYGGGGAVFINNDQFSAMKQADINFRNTVFEDNKLVVALKYNTEIPGLDAGGGYSNGGGGAVYIGGGIGTGISNLIMDFTGSRFLNNRVDVIACGTHEYVNVIGRVGGGAVSIVEGAGARFDNTYFYGNSVRADGSGRNLTLGYVGGGAVSVMGASVNASFANTLFESNTVSLTNMDVYSGTSPMGGGAVYVSGSSGRADFSNAKFINNESIVTGRGITHAGGGGFIGSGYIDTLLFDGAEFSNNRTVVNSKDGELSFSAGGGGAMILNNASIKDTLFTGNSADIQVRPEFSHMTGGGAVFALGNIDATNASFINNQTTTNGGAVYVSGGTFTIGADAGKVSLWRGNTDSSGANSIYFNAENTVNLNVGLNGGIVDMREPIRSGGDAWTQVSITGTSGTWILGGENILDSKVYWRMRAGANALFHLDENATVWMNPEKGGQLWLEGGTFSQGWNSQISASLINVSNTAAMRLAVNGVNNLAIGSHRLENALSFTNTSSYVPGQGSYFSVDNDLMQAYYERNGDSGYDLVVNILARASDIIPEARVLEILAANPGADIRHRLALDSVYSTGGIFGETSTLVDTLNFGPAMAAANVLHNNVANLGATTRTHLANYSFASLSHDAAVASSAALASPDFAFATNWQPRNYIWASAGKRFATQRTTSKVAGYDFNPYDLTLGYDRVCGPWVYGISAQYTNGKAKSRDGIKSQTKIESAAAQAYLSYHGDRWYGTVGIQAGTGWNKSDVIYTALGQATHGSYRSSMLGGNLEFGYLFTVGYDAYPFQIIPHAGIDYSHLRSSGFSERGSLALARRFNSTNWDTVELPIGVKFAKSFCAGSSVITPSVDVSYARNVGQTGAQSTASFVALPGQTWRIDSVHTERNIFRMEAQLKANLNQRVEVALDYDLELRKKYTDQRIGVSFRVGF